MPPHDPRPDDPIADVLRSDVPRTAPDEPAPPAPSLLAEQLRALASAPDAEQTLRLAVAAVIETAEGADCADVTVDRDGVTTTLAASDDLAAAIGALQDQVDEGPCLSSLRDGAFVLAPDLAHDDRWPRFAPGAVDRGIRSVTAHPLYVDDGTSRHVYGALNVFGRRTDQDHGGVEAGAIVAAHCSLLLHAHAVREQLRAAIDTRDLIGQAKGVLMERHGVAAPTAFQMLRRASMDLNTKLREVAAQVAATTIRGED